MGVVHVSFELDCDVVVGDEPAQPGDPVGNPVVVGRTNARFIMTDGLYCFSLVSPQPFTPLSQIGQVMPSDMLALQFTLAVSVQPAPPARPVGSGRGA
jgi:hypothetical protein